MTLAWNSRKALKLTDMLCLLFIEKINCMFWANLRLSIFRHAEFMLWRVCHWYIGKVTKFGLFRIIFLGVIAIFLQGGVVYAPPYTGLGLTSSWVNSLISILVIKKENVLWLFSMKKSSCSSFLCHLLVMNFWAFISNAEDLWSGYLNKNFHKNTVKPSGSQKITKKKQ